MVACIISLGCFTEQKLIIAPLHKGFYIFACYPWNRIQFLNIHIPFGCTNSQHKLIISWAYAVWSVLYHPQLLVSYWPSYHWVWNAIVNTLQLKLLCLNTICARALELYLNWDIGNLSSLNSYLKLIYAITFHVLVLRVHTTSWRTHYCCCTRELSHLNCPKMLTSALCVHSRQGKAPHRQAVHKVNNATISLSHLFMGTEDETKWIPSATTEWELCVVVIHILPASLTDFHHVMGYVLFDKTERYILGSKLLFDSAPRNQPRYPHHRDCLLFYQALFLPFLFAAWVTLVECPMRNSIGWATGSILATNIGIMF